MTGRTRQPVNYDPIAGSYDQRFSYPAGERKGVAGALQGLADEVRASRILEVGCGTGRWVAALQRDGREVIGLDRSAGMLREARGKTQSGWFVQGDAGALPFAGGTFDVVFCVSALHHFADQRGFVRQAPLLLKPGGALAIVGMNPHAGRDQWYLYDYFPDTYETDLRRYPPPDALSDWMVAAGFDSVDHRVADRLSDTRTGRTVLDDPMLRKEGTSVLTPLSDEEYEAGLARIRAAIARSDAAGEEIVFPVDLTRKIHEGADVGRNRNASAWYKRSC
jgi:ubiquinone/menaquinone biosynthesis C-methylase UbiE